MLERPLPRFVITKRLATGRVAFYWSPPKYIYVDEGCPIAREPLGNDYASACGEDGKAGRAATLNGLFDEWRLKRDGEPLPGIAKFGTIDWLFREFKSSESYQRRVSLRTRPDYERIMLLVANHTTKKGDRIGERRIKSLTPAAADKLYSRIIEGPRGLRLRQGEKVIALCRHAWRVVHRLHPDLFDAAVPNPWEGVTKQPRTLAAKPAATREQVYAFAWAAIDAGRFEAAAAAVICFEWLQRPENVLAGYVTWTGYRSQESPNAVRIEHHKTGAVVPHPLQDRDGTFFYADAEAVLAHLPRRGVPMILKPRRDGTAEPFTPFTMGRVVRLVRRVAGLPATFTLDACRHGGMTELEEAELTDGQGRALSGHRSKAYDRYAKRTMDRALAATRKRHAHLMANAGAAADAPGLAAAENAAGTDCQNAPRFGCQNAEDDDDAAIA
jgi:hypothetical protein